MANQAKVAQIYAELQLSTAKFKAAIGEATNETRKFSQEMRKNSEEARGAIALLGEEIGVRLPRHVRGFVAELPGVAKAMSAAFNAVAIFAIINTIVEAGNKIREFVQKTEEAAKKNAEAWAESAKDIKSVNASLESANARIEDTIAKLEKHPGENGIKSALVEASEQADKLGEKLDKDLKKLSDVKEQSTLASLLTGGKSGTDKAAATAALRLQSIIDDYNDTLSRVAESGDTKNYNKVRVEQLSRIASDPEFNAAFAQLADYLKQNQNLVGAKNPNFDNAASAFNIISGAVRSLNLQADQEQGGQKVATLTNAKEANDALQKADAERLKAFEAKLAREKALYGISAAQERAYWEAKLKEMHNGTNAYASALEKFASSSEQVSKQFERIRRSTAGSTDGAPGIILNERGNDQLGAATARRAEEQAKLNVEWTAAADRLGLLNGSVTAHEAALHEAAAHAEEYRIQLGALQDQLKQLQDEGALADALGGDPQNAAKQTQVRSQIDALQTRARIAALTDAQNTLGTTWKGIVDGVFDELIRRANDTQHQIQQISLHLIDGLNGELAKGITGGKTNFGAVFQSASQSLAKTGLEKLEGSLFKGLGLGSKRDGSSASNALFVQMAGGPTVTGRPAGKAIGGISHSLLGFLNDSNFASSLFGGKLFGAGSLLGGFADGGDVRVGGMYRIGERGPETMYLPAGAHVTPNGAYGSVPLTYNIDARGTDAAMVHDAVIRASRAAAAQGSAHAQRAIAERARRRPQG